MYYIRKYYKIKWIEAGDKIDLSYSYDFYNSLLWQVSSTYVFGQKKTVVLMLSLGTGKFRTCGKVLTISMVIVIIATIIGTIISSVLFNNIVYSIIQSSTEVLSTDYSNTIDERLLTIWSINSLVNEEELLTASIAIDNLVANDYIVAWKNFFPDKPLVYLREKNNFAVLLDDEKAYNSYLLADKYGILIRRYDEAPTKYYIFKYVQ